jgi:hypothetical protein
MRKQLIHDVIHDLIGVRQDEVIRKGKLGRGSLEPGKGRPRTFGTAQTRIGRNEKKEKE